MESKNIYILKSFIENDNLTPEAITLIAALRGIIIKDIEEYFLTYNMLCYYVFRRLPTRRELDAVKNGFANLVDNNIIRIKENYSKAEFLCDLSNLYYDLKDGYYVCITDEELVKVMNIKNNVDKYKVFKYYLNMVGTFNHSKKIDKEYRGKFGGYSLDTLSNQINMSKSTIIQYNTILEENEMMYIIRHKDYNKVVKGTVKELPNTYCRYRDRSLALEFLSKINSDYFTIDKTKTKKANVKRGMAQKYIAFCKGKEYDKETLKQIYLYCEEWNKEEKRKYEEEKKRGYSPKEPVYKDTKILSCLL